MVDDLSFYPELLAWWVGFSCNNHLEVQKYVATWVMLLIISLSHVHVYLQNRVVNHKVSLKTLHLRNLYEAACNPSVSSLG